MEISVGPGTDEARASTLDAYGRLGLAGFAGDSSGGVRDAFAVVRLRT